MKWLRRFWKWLTTPHPINRYVNGVELPAVDDPRWFAGANGAIEFHGAHLSAHVMGLDYNVWYWLVVDGVKWDDGGAPAYAQAVIQSIRYRERQMLLEQSRNYARNTFKTN